MIITATISGRTVPSVYRDLHRAFFMTYRMKFHLLPPLELSKAAALSGLTGIVGIFFFKDYLDLPAEFLAMLGFGAGVSPRVKKLTLIPSSIVLGSGNCSRRQFRHYAGGEPAEAVSNNRSGHGK